MASDAVPVGPAQALAKSRGWLIAGGILSLFVGFAAMSFPVLFTGVIVKLIGAFALVNGIILVGVAIFGHHQAHRVVEGLSGLLRIAVGLMLLLCTFSGAAAITLIIAILFGVEGVSCIVGAVKMRSHSGWFWLLLNGIAALVLGLMIWARWPNNTDWILGLLYGINSLFMGFSMLFLGLGAKKAA